MNETVQVAVAVARALESVGIEYALGGSVATSVQGEPRSTNDIDFAVRLHESQVEKLIAALGPDFDVDEESLREAVRQRRSANIFHLGAMVNVDLFNRGAVSFDQSEFSRRVRVDLQPGPIYLATTEDNLLRKLRWFRIGGEVSDRQWRDILGLLRVSGETLDLIYLRRWAKDLGIEDLLERALATKGTG